MALLLVAGSAGLALWTVGRARLTDDVYSRHEAEGNALAANLEQRLVWAEAVVTTLARIVGAQPEGSGIEALKVRVPLALDTDRGFVAGGGLWPEPGAFVPGVERASLFWGRDRTGRLVFYDEYNDPEGPGYHREEWYVPGRHLKPNQVFWSRTYVDPYTSQPMVTGTAPIYRDGRFLGVVTIDLKLEGFREVVAGMGERIGGYGFVLDRNQTFVSYPGHDAVQRQGGEESGTNSRDILNATEFASRRAGFEPIARAVSAIEDRVTADLRTADPSVGQIARAIMTDAAAVDPVEALRIAAMISAAGGLAADETHFQKRLLLPAGTFRDQAVAVSIFFMPRTHWKIVTIVPEGRITAQVTELLAQFTLFAILLVLLVGAVAWVALRRGVIVPLRKMTGDLRRITEGGDVCSGLELSRVGNELDQLAYWFNHRTRLLEDARTAAERANTSKSDFLANMSHEIRTPMTAILGYTDVLLDPEEDEDSKREATHIIKGNGDHLLCVINDLLDLSKLESGKLEVERAPVSLRDMVSGVVKLMEVRAVEKHIGLTLEVDEALPPTVPTDALRVRQVLLNLVGNAIKFTKSGGVKVSVRWGAAPDGTRRVAFEVIDTGIGLTPEQIARLFEPFSQADSSMTRRFGGTGLGLSISLRLARLLGGDIRVHSRPGVGSRFTFTIKPGAEGGVDEAGIADEAGREGLAAADVGSETTARDPARGPTPPVAPRRSGPAVPDGGHVLLVEDVLVNRELLKRILQKMGYRVDTAENGQEAVDAYEASVRHQDPLDAIVMDIQMPVMDGHTAAGHLRRNGYAGFLMACTAHALTGDREKCLEAGFDDVVTKPISKVKLLEKLGGAALAGATKSAGAPV